MSENGPVPGLTGYIPLADAIERAAKMWRCDRAQAWQRLRPWLVSGELKAKMPIPAVGTTMIPSEDWDHAKNDASHEDGLHGHAIWYDIRWPAYLSQRDLGQLLDEAKTAKTGKAGNPGVYDWEGMWIEIVKLARDGDLPKDYLALRKLMQQWFQDTIGREPQSKQMPDLKRLYERLTNAEE